MKNKLLFVPLLILYGFAFVNAFSGNGDGSSGVPYEITNCTQLQEMEDNFSASYILVNEINCSDTINWNDSSGFSPIGSGVGDEDYFFGTFNGQGYKIINLYINRNIETYIGLFGYIINATISNINLENVNILGNAEVGGLVGYNNGGTILNSSVSGNVTEIVDYQKAGCLVGENTLGTIDKSFSNCSLIIMD